ncbi:MAG: amidohydrolase [Eubacteriales bacterium]|nr:amidohydrolase [Eubacteriales bacterium]
MNVMQAVLENKDYTIAMRRHFHQYPELGWKEFETAKRIREELAAFGIPYETVGETGTIATLKGGDGPVVGLRADIDALPITEENDVPYKSKNEGVMHACGHDAHIAMLLTAAKIFAANRDKITGTVKFIFQPAEECATSKRAGATEMMNSGLMEDIDTVCGMHVLPMIESGLVSVDEGPRYSSCAFMKIRIIGKSGHGAMPHYSIDPIYIACKVVDALQSIASRETNPNDTVVVSICSFHAGSAANTIDDAAELLGTVRTFNPQLQKELPGMIERIIANTCAAYRGTYEFDYYCDMPATINDANCSVLAADSVRTALGEEKLTKYYRTPGGEDFSYMLERYPGIYAFVGCRSEAKDCVYPLHHRRFNLDEDAMASGAALYVQYALDAMNKTW